MDVKGAFDHVSRSRIFKHMIDFSFEENLIAWTRSFLTNQKIQLHIDGHKINEGKIKTGIPQGSPLSPIFFLIHISGVFNTVTEVSPLVISL